jgi:hypothetical protein
MKKERYFWLAGLFLCLWLPGRPAAAAYVTGDDLARTCRGGESVNIFSCLNYIAGVIDYHVMMQSLGTAPTIDFCLPDGLPLEKAAVAVMLYLKKAPQHDSFIAAPAVAMALHEKYPCAPIRSGKKKK